MAKHSARETPPENLLLAGLPRAEYQRLLPFLQPVTLTFRQVLYEYRAGIDYAYFPEQGVASALTLMQDGSAIEVATIGFEGMVGLGTMFGPSISPNKVIVQVAGNALRIRSVELRAEALRDNSLRAQLLRYQTAFWIQVSQTVACNGLHAVQQRCCRWLLMTQDRMRTAELFLTHEFLAVMLGVRRPSVSEVLGPLQARGLIKSGRGRITVLDRRGLEAASCECYRVVTDEFKRAFKV